MTNEEVLSDLAMLIRWTFTVASLRSGDFSDLEASGSDLGELWAVRKQPFGAVLPPKPVAGRLLRTPWL